MQQQRKHKTSRQAKRVSDNKGSTQSGKQGKKAHKAANKYVIKQTSKKGCLRRTNVGLDLVFVVPLYWNNDDTYAFKQSSQKGLGISCAKMAANSHEILGRN